MTTVEKLQEFLSGEKYVKPRVKCVDGFEVSIQASKTHYCSPRENEGPYYLVELGFPSLPLEILKEYAEEEDDLVNTVYGYVPIEKVVAVLDEHGGLV
jgi:hypothetical protein